MYRLCETAHTLFSWIYLYWLTVINYGQPASLLDIHWSSLAPVPFTFLVTVIVHVISTFPQKLHQADDAFVAILCFPGPCIFRQCRHSPNFWDRGDFTFYRWDLRSCIGFYYPLSPRILFPWEMALDRPMDTLNVY